MDNRRISNTMRIGCITLLCALVVAATAKRIPWQDPCGRQLSIQRLKPNQWQKKLQISITLVLRQLNNAINHLKHEDIEKIYKQAELHDHQLSCIWLPGQGDVVTLMKQKQINLKQLHIGLQKFSIAFEEIITDEWEETRNQSLNSIHSYCNLILCETEAALVVLEIGLPKTASRDIMSSEERNPQDETRRLLRDWAVLLRYRKYLAGWAKYLRRYKKKTKRN